MNFAALRIGLRSISVTRQSMQLAAMQQPRHCIRPHRSPQLHNVSPAEAPVEEKRVVKLNTKIKGAIRRMGKDELAEPYAAPAILPKMRCVAYCAARQYDLKSLVFLLGNYHLSPRKRTDEFLHARLAGPSQGQVFFFKDGCAVTWNTSEEEDRKILRDSRQAEVDRFDENLRDSEEMWFTEDKLRSTGMQGEDIIIGGSDATEALFAKLAFSHGMARSTQLGVLEKHLSHYLASIEHIPLYMMKGQQPPMSARDVMRKHGQLLYIRGLLNLHSELVDSLPEFYWSRIDLAKYFESISRTLDIVPRIKVINQRLDHANRLVDLMTNNLNHRHGARMEWIIIALIAVEVVFECVHYWKSRQSELSEDAKLEPFVSQTSDL